MKSIRLPLLILALAALGFSGCGDDEDDAGGGGGAAGGGSSQSAPPAAKGGTVKISETDFKISPSSPSVKAGEVTFDVSNDGQSPHALEVEGAGIEEETETLQPGDSAKLTVDLGKDGTYEMYCPVGNHRQLGMEGEITVGSGGSAAAPSDDSGKDEPEDESGDDSGGGGGSSGY